MLKTFIVSALCSVVLFVWGFISWALLPWHNAVAKKFINEAEASQFLKQQAHGPGIYYLPYSAEDHKSGQTSAFINLIPDGFDMNMGKLMGQALLGQFICAWLVCSLLKCTSGLSYSKRVGFVALVGALIGFASHFPYWNWFGFPTEYVAIMVADYFIAWLLAGIFMAAFVGRAQNP